jgi:hypothetical protein
MSSYYDEALLSSQYSKLFFENIYFLYQKNLLNFSSYSLNTTKELMFIIIKQICHFYFINKLKFSKILVNVSFELFQKSLFKNHNELICIINAVYNNIGCIYEKEENLLKSLQFFKYSGNYLESNDDKLIYYNNMIKICYKINNKSEIKNYMKLFYELLIKEMEIIKNENIFNINESIEKKNKIKLLSFLFYNYCFALENILEKKKKVLKCIKKVMNLLLFY